MDVCRKLSGFKEERPHRVALFFGKQAWQEAEESKDCTWYIALMILVKLTRYRPRIILHGHI